MGEVYIAVAKTPDEASKALEADGYTVLKSEDGKPTDLNQGAGRMEQGTGFSFHVLWNEKPVPCSQVRCWRAGVGPFLCLRQGLSRWNRREALHGPHQSGQFNDVFVLVSHVRCAQCMVLLLLPKKKECYFCWEPLERRQELPALAVVVEAFAHREALSLRGHFLTNKKVLSRFAWVRLPCAFHNWLRRSRPRTPAQHNRPFVSARAFAGIGRGANGFAGFHYCAIGFAGICNNAG